jgi:hypothetical protein
MAQLKSATEIEKELYKAQGWTHTESTDVAGMTYEQGVEAALRWVLGEDDSEPIENEFTDTE